MTPEELVAHVRPEFGPDVPPCFAEKREAKCGENGAGVGTFVGIVSHGERRGHAMTENNRCIETGCARVALPYKNTGCRVKTAVNDGAIRLTVVAWVLMQQRGQYAIRKCAHAQVANGGCAKALAVGA